MNSAMNDMIKPVEAIDEKSGEQIYYYPFMTKIVCDSHEWSRLCDRKQQNYQIKTICCLCSVTKAEATDCEHNPWHFPIGIDHCINLAATLKKFSDWKGTGYHPINAPLMDNLRECEFMADPFYSIQPDHAHDTLNVTGQLLKAFCTNAKLTIDHKITLFAMTKEIVERNHLWSGKIKWEKHWSTASVFQNITLSLAPALIVSIETAIGCTEIFNNNILSESNLGIVEALFMVSDTLLTVAVGFKDCRIDYHLLSAKLKEVSAKKNIGIRQYGNEKAEENINNMDGKKNGFTAFSLHHHDHGLRSIARVGNAWLFGAERFEKTNKENKAASHRGQFVKSSEDNIMDNNILRYIFTILLEGGGLDENMKLIHGNAAKWKLKRSILLNMKPYKGINDWKGLSRYVDRNQNRNFYQYVDGHKLLSHQKTSRQSLLQFLERTDLMNDIIETWNDIYQLKEFKHCEIVRCDRSLLIEHGNVIGKSFDGCVKMTDFRCYEVEKILNINTKDYFICKEIEYVGIPKKKHLFHRVMIGRVTDKRFCIQIEDIHIVLTAFHRCTSQCKVIPKKSIIHRETDKINIHWYGGRGTILFSPLIMQYGKTICTNNFCQKKYRKSQ